MLSGTDVVLAMSMFPFMPRLGSRECLLQSPHWD